MSARKLSDKEFDRYTKNLLKKPEGVAFDKAAWAAMEQQLSQAGPASPTINFKWLIALIAVIVASFGFLIYQTQGVRQSVEEGFEQNQSVEPESTILTDDNSDDLNSDQEAVAAGIQPIEKLGLNPQTEVSGNATEAASQSNNLQEAESITNVSDTEKQAETPETEDIDSQSTENEELDRDEVASTPSVKDSNETTKSSAKQTAKSTPDLPKQSQVVSAPTLKKEEQNVTQTEIWLISPKNTTVALAEVEEQQLILTPKNVQYQMPSDSVLVQQKNNLPFQRWSVGLTLAPDFSTVGQLNEFTQPGMDVGLSVEYFISRRLSITTGAILTRKLYNTTDVSEYTFPSGIWNGGLAPEEIMANCQVIDIPINLRYRVIEGKRTTLFASAGISSYLMLNERYDYNYAYGQQTTQPDSWEVSNENNHFFGVYNVSAGISRRVWQNISIEAEPFLKSSLGGVGWGQVRLKSTGVLLHIKYNF